MIISRYVALITKNLQLSYYDERGILISDKRKCFLYYVTRSFILDIIGTLPWIEAVRPLINKHIDDNNKMLINTASKFSHLYILFGYFDYIADLPTNNITYIMIIKWQIILILVMLGGSHYLMSYCVSYTFDDQMNVIHAKSLNTCWLPKFFELNDEPTPDQLNFLVAQSFNLVQCGFVMLNFGRFYIDRVNLGVGVGLGFFGFFFSFVTCYSLAMLILNSRGHTLFLHGVNQLKRFLKAERVDPKLIHQALQHFGYWWMRMKGITIHHLTSERISVVFRQDLSYYFYQKTYMALDSLLKGGESLGRELASASTQVYFLPGQQIIREMDLVPSVYVVHRGSVTLSKDERKILKLTKGGIFGQLDGAMPRPIRISGVAEEYADLLQIPIKQFQDFISDEVRENISKNPQSQHDFLATKEYVPENPYNTIQYILRGRKTIKLPWMKLSIDARHSNRYSIWLYLVWWIGPVLSAWIVLILNTLPLHLIHQVCWILVALDLLHLANFIAEFYTRKVGPVLLKMTIVLLILHSMTCGWIYVACRDTFTIEFEIPEEVNITIDYEQWALPKDRHGGCARVTKNFKSTGPRRPSFVVPKYWQDDYAVAMTFIILIHTHTSLDAVMALTLQQVYYKVLINAVMYLIDIWMTSAAISSVYTRLRELYQYDYNVSNLTTYLNHCDLSPALLESVKVYAMQLWSRQRGNWLPELAANAPMCIREDLFGALYMHHLRIPPLFRQLPSYFTRQLVARLQRIVIFPGKCIVQEGDVYACMYFIHEGEVEKWVIAKSGERKMMSLLTVNGYFGFIPGLFPNTAFQFTYYARTVVDLVYLKLKDWQDLLDSYPDVKRDLYTNAGQLKKDLAK